MGSEQAVTAQPFVEVKVVFNSEPRVFRVNENEPVRALLHKSAADFDVASESQNLVLRRGNQPLDPATRIEDLALGPEDVLYLERRTPPSGG